MLYHSHMIFPCNKRRGTLSFTRMQFSCLYSAQYRLESLLNGGEYKPMALPPLPPLCPAPVIVEFLISSRDTLHAESKVENMYFPLSLPLLKNYLGSSLSLSIVPRNKIIFPRSLTKKMECVRMSEIPKTCQLLCTKPVN